MVNGSIIETRLLEDTVNENSDFKMKLHLATIFHWEYLA